MRELREDSTIIEWLNIINARPNTEKNYLLGFQWFTEWTGKDPETLLLEAEQDNKDGLLMRQMNIKISHRFQKIFTGQGKCAAYN